MSKFIERTQFSRFDFNAAKLSEIDWNKASLREKAMVQFQTQVANPDSKLNKEQGGLLNVRTVRVMQAVDEQGGEKFDLLLVLRVPEYVLRADREQKEREEKRKKELEESREKALKEGRCATHPDYFGKFPPTVGCEKCLEFFVQRKKFLAKRSLGKAAEGAKKSWGSKRPTKDFKKPPRKNFKPAKPRQADA